MILKGFIDILTRKPSLRKQLKEAHERIGILEKENALLRQNLELLSGVEAKNAELTLKVERLQYTVDQLLKHRFGSKSERFEDGDDPQMPLFSELIDESNESDDKSPPPIQPKSPSNDTNYGKGNGSGKKKNKKRILFPEDLRHEVKEIDVAEDLKTCGCGKLMPIIGYTSNEVISYNPEEFYITEERLLKRACSCKKCIRIAKAPKRILPKVLIANDLLAQIVIAKCLDRQPIYHLEQRWASRHEMMIPRDNMTRWTNQLANKLQPIYNLIQEEFSEYDIGSLDATWLQVLKEDGREPQTKSKAWCFVGGKPETPVVLFEYCADEHVGFLTEKLQEFKGYLHGDADNAYTSFHNLGISMVYCNAHNRRHYVPIAESTKSEGIAKHVILEYQKLYQIEEEIRNFTPDQKKEIRQKEAKPIFDALHTYLVNRYDKIPPKSVLGEAVHYTLKFWKGLIKYLDDGRLSIDNNHTERIIRKLVMARNNFLFADTVKGAKALCLHFSLIQTAIANGLEPYKYYEYILDKLPYCETVEDYEALLPWNLNKDALKKHYTMKKAS